jgi:cupin 2 domain-containing protein
LRTPRNIFETARAGNKEVIEQLARGQGFRIERIVSRGHSSPEGFWYDQDESEFVVLLSGSAAIRFESTDELVEMKPGDSMEIPAHVRHRVEWTDPDQASVWLAAFYSGSR